MKRDGIARPLRSRGEIATGSRFFVPPTLPGFLVGWLILLLFTPVSPAASSPDASTLQNTRIIVGADQNYPPYEFMDEDGEPAGFNIDILRAIGRAMGLDIEFRLERWSHIRSEFEAGRIDMLSGMFYSEARDQRVDFSVPHSVVHHAVFVRHGSPIRSLSDVRDKAIIVQCDDIMHDYVRSERLSDRIIAVQDQADALQLLLRGQHDCALIARLNGEYLIRNQGYHGITAVGAPILPQEYCFAVSPGNRVLLGKLNEGLHLIKITGRYKAIQARWLGVVADDSSLWIRLATWTLLPSLTLLGVAWFWNWSLKHQVRQRSEEIRQEFLMRKQAEAALHDSEEKYRELVMYANSMILRLDPQGRITFMNEFARRCFGYSLEEIIGRNVVGTIVPATDSAGRNLGSLVQRILTDPDHHTSNQNETIGRDGKRLWVAWTNKAIRNGDGQLIEILCIGNDITEIKKTEAALRESEARYRELADLLPQTVFEVSITGRLTFANRAAFETFSHSQEDFDRGLFAVDMLVPEDRERGMRNIQQVLQGVRVFKPAEYTAQRKDGSRFPILIYSTAIMRDGAPIGLRGIILDITERKKMDEEIIKAHKLESLGVLAGGIAHDFNNILTAIVGNISFAKMCAPSDAQITRRLDETERAALRARDLTQQLLTFSKGGEPVKKTVSIAEIVRETATFALRGSNVRCEFAVSQDLWAVDADVGQISRVINNLVINAHQAMPEGGVMRVMAENIVTGSTPELPLRPGRCIRISVQDEGQGIPETQIPRIFDPYFTTKEAGSGLGLATVYSIIGKHHGYVSVESQVGVGTTFHVYLPASEAGVVMQRGGMEMKTVAGKGKILLMDDEEILREVVSDILTYLGYETACACDGLEAVAMYREARTAGAPFDAVIMDLTVPGGMGGKEAIKQLLAIDPGVKAIVSSGYSNDPVMAEYETYGFVGVVAKPFRIEALGEVLSRAIEGPG